jgi:hypothetical protein
MPRGVMTWLFNSRDVCKWSNFRWHRAQCRLFVAERIDYSEVLFLPGRCLLPLVSQGGIDGGSSILAGVVIFFALAFASLGTSIHLQF